MIETDARCDGCLRALTVFDQVGGWTVCLECTKARHRAAMTHRCACGRRRRESEVHATAGVTVRHVDGTIKRVGGRRWISCLRCLGQVRQLS